MKRTSPIKSRLEYAGISLLSLTFRLLPLSIARGFAGGLGGFVAKVIHLRRKVALDNLQNAFPETHVDELERIYTDAWRHFVRLGAEMARLPAMKEKHVHKLVDLSATTVLDDALSKGNGGIVVSGHLGNWEWMGGCAAKIGYPITYVVTSQSNELAEKWIDRLRESTGIEIVNRRNAVKGVLRALKRNRIVAILCDQDAHESGVFVPFFNRMASTPRGPAVFHLKTGTPIIFGANPKLKSGKYRVTLERMAFDDLTGRREEDEAIIMGAITTRLEAEIRKYPDQWLWLHRRWKTRP